MLPSKSHFNVFGKYKIFFKPLETLKFNFENALNGIQIYSGLGSTLLDNGIMANEILKTSAARTKPKRRRINMIEHLLLRTATLDVNIF